MTIEGSEAHVAQHTQLDSLLFDQAPVGLGSTDTLGRFQRVNDALCRVLARPMTELVGSPLSDLVSAEPSAADDFFRRLHDHELASAEVLYTAADGRQGWLEVVAATSYDRDGRPLGFIAAISKIDARKRREFERDDELARCHQLRDGSEVLIAILAHDLANPLTAVTTGLQLLGGMAESERAGRVLERMRTSAERMRCMTGQLLEFTRLRAGHGLALERSAVDLELLSRHATREVAACHGAPEASCRIQVLGDARGDWDLGRLSQLLSHLIGNALQHRRPATPITVTLDGRAPDLMLLDVWNQGTIGKELMPLLFDPIRRARQRRDTNAAGLGLGLYLSQQIAIAHGGGLHVESNEASGTHVTVRLPRRASGRVQP